MVEPSTADIDQLYEAVNEIRFVSKTLI